MLGPETENRYFYLELGATLAGLYSVVLLLKEVLGVYTFALALGITVSFGLSFLVRYAADRSLKAILTAAACLVFLGTVYAILNSTFSYRDVVAIWIKGISILILILAYGVFAGEFLSFVQILGIPLFMSWPVFVKSPGLPHLLLVLFYLASWFVILRLRLYVYSGFIELKRPAAVKWAVVLSATFAASLLLSAVLFSLCVPESVKRGGLLRNNLAMQEDQMDISEQDYYELQNEMQKGMGNAIPEFNESSKRFAANAAVSVMVKESPDIIELKHAEDGLVSILKKPGPGLDKDKRKNLIALIVNFTDKKINLNLQRQKYSVFNEMRKSVFGVPRRLALLLEMNKMHTAKTYKGMRKAASEVRDKIEKYPGEHGEKEKLKDEFQIFEDWKILETYRRQMRAIEVMPEGLSKAIRPHLEALAREIGEAKDVQSLKSAGEKVEEMRERLKPNESEPGKFGALTRELRGQLGELSKEIRQTTDPVQIPQLGNKAERIKDNFESASAAGEGKTRSEIDRKILSELAGIAEEIKSSEDIAALQKVADRIEEVKRDLERMAKKAEEAATAEEKKEQAKELAAAQEELEKLKDAAEVKMALLFREKAAELAKKMEGTSAEQAMREALQQLQKAENMTDLKAAEDKVKDAQEKMPKPQEQPPEQPLEAQAAKPEEEKPDKDEEVLKELLAAKEEMLLREKMNQKEEEAKKEEKPKPPERNPVQERLPWIILAVILGALLLAGMIFLTLYIIIITRRSELTKLKEKDPRAFIIMLYENAKGVLGVFGSRYYPFIPPLTYARNVNDKFALKTQAFPVLTVKYEEAEYSSHSLQAADAEAALSVYNEFMAGLLAAHDSAELYFLRYPVLLLRRLPTSI